LSNEFDYDVRFMKEYESVEEWFKWEIKYQST
jgi:hypothetical protein